MAAAASRRATLAAGLVVALICAHLLVLLYGGDSNKNLTRWKLRAVAQASHEALAGETVKQRRVHRYSRDLSILAVPSNRQFEIVSSESPLHAEYVRCCESSALSGDTKEDFVCTCRDEEGEGALENKRTPVGEIERMALEVLAEVEDQAARREDIFGSSSLGGEDLAWFVQHRDDPEAVQDAVFGPPGAAREENEPGFALVDRKFALWCEDRSTKTVIERRFERSNGLRERIYNRTRCEADEYDLGRGCLRKNKRGVGRATNNGILETELAEKERALAERGGRYESPVRLRAERRVAEIEAALLGGRLRAEASREAEAAAAEEADGGAEDTTPLEELFRGLEAIEKGEGDGLGDLPGLRESCRSEGRREFTERLLGVVSEQAQKEEEARVAEEQRRRRKEEQKQEARRRDRQKKRARSAGGSSAKGAGSTPSPPPPPPPPPPPSPPPSPPAQRNGTSPTSSRPSRRSKRGKSRPRGPSPRQRALPSLPPPPPASPSDEDSRALVREKRKLVRSLRKEEEDCHKLYQAELKRILGMPPSQQKKVHAGLAGAENAKQTCIRRAKRKYDMEAVEMGLAAGV